MEQPLNEQFVQARQKLNVTLDEAAASLNLPVKQLEKFESSEWDTSTMNPFERGYMRNYAQYLGVDVRECEHLFPEGEEVGSNLKSVRRFHKYPAPSPLLGSGFARFMWLLLILSVAAWLVWMVI